MVSTSSSRADIGRSTLTEIWLRSSPRYSQNPSQGNLAHDHEVDALAFGEAARTRVATRPPRSPPPPCLDRLGGIRIDSSQRR
jgi:hypothetical protein